MNCDLCGKEFQEDAGFFIVEIEGTKMSVCYTCSKFGKVIKRPGRVSTKSAFNKEKIVEKQHQKETEQVIVPKYAELIKNKREQLGLNHKDFAKMISEKESVVSKLESGFIEPNIELAKKLERILKVKLIEEREIIGGEKTSVKSEEMTLGDIAKLKKRQHQQ